MSRRSARTIAQGGGPSGVRANFTAQSQRPSGSTWRNQSQNNSNVHIIYLPDAASQREQLGQFIEAGNFNAVKEWLVTYRARYGGMFIKADFENPVMIDGVDSKGKPTGRRLLEHSIVMAAYHGPKESIFGDDNVDAGKILVKVLDDMKYLNLKNQTPITQFRKEAMQGILHMVVEQARRGAPNNPLIARRHIEGVIGILHENGIKVGKKLRSKVTWKDPRGKTHTGNVYNRLHLHGQLNGGHSHLIANTLRKNYEGPKTKSKYNNRTRLPRNNQKLKNVKIQLANMLSMMNMGNRTQGRANMTGLTGNTTINKRNEKRKRT